MPAAETKAAEGAVKLPELVTPESVSTNASSCPDGGPKSAQQFRSSVLQPLMELMEKAVMQEPVMAQTPNELVGFLVRWLLLEQLKPPMEVVQPLLTWLGSTIIGIEAANAAPVRQCSKQQGSPSKHKEMTYSSEASMNGLLQNAAAAGVAVPPPRNPLAKLKDQNGSENKQGSPEPMENGKEMRKSEGPECGFGISLSVKSHHTDSSGGKPSLAVPGLQPVRPEGDPSGSLPFRRSVSFDASGKPADPNVDFAVLSLPDEVVDNLGPLKQLSRTDICDRLRKVHCFKNLSYDECLELAANFEVRRFLPGESLIKLGEKGQGAECRLMFMEEGECKVSVLHQVSTLRAGDVFGEQLWMRPHLPAEQMVEAWAAAPIQCLVPKPAWDGEAVRKKLNMKRTKVVAKTRRPATPPPKKVVSRMESTEEEAEEEVETEETNCQRKAFARMHTPKIDWQGKEGLLERDMDNDKTDDERRTIEEAIRSSEILMQVLNITDSQVTTLVDRARSSTIPCEVTCIKQGDDGGDEGCSFWIVEDGLMESRDEGGYAKKLRNGDCFGEMGLIHGRYTETVVAARHSVVWQLDRALFTQVRLEEMEQDKEIRVELLKTVPLLSDNLCEEDLVVLAGDLESCNFAQGEHVIEAGVAPLGLHFIREGQLEVDDDEEIHAGPDTYVGMDALMGEPAQQCWHVVSSSCFTLCLTVAAIEDRVGCTYAELVTRLSEEETKRQSIVPAMGSKPLGRPTRGSVFINREMTLDQMRRRTFKDSDESLHTLEENAEAHPKDRLECIGILGAGSFGLVTYERDPDTQQYFALKALSKGHVIFEGIKEQVQHELQCWRLIHSDFWVKLFATYKDDQMVYFLTEAALGGELFDAFQDNPHLFGRLDVARFYGAGAVLGLQAMHEKQMVYRDLKMENMLLCAGGYPKLADFGIAKFIGHGQTFTACGTPDYLAPEVLRLTGHNRAVDWWTLGVVIFMMMSGYSPFDAEHVAKIYANIVKGFKKETFPDSFSPRLIGVISSLSRKRPHERLPMHDISVEKGVKALEEHSWFKGFDWEAMAARTMQPPYLPHVRTNDEIAHNSPKDRPPVMPYVDDGTGWDDDFGHVHESFGTAN